MIRLLAFCLLLLHLQPVMGAVLCVHDTEFGQRECGMPQDDRPVDRILTAADTDASPGCANTAYCTRSAPAVLHVGQRLQITPVSQGTPALFAASPASDAAPTPPFHPPRA